MGVEMLVDDIPDLQYFGHVDDEYASFEWSEGGMIHVHIAFWIVGAPRIDKIEVPREKGDDGTTKTWVEIDVVPDGAVVVPESAAADRLATFWDRSFTEFNVAKAMVGAGSKAPVSDSGFPKAWASMSALATAVGVRQDLGTVEEKSAVAREYLLQCARALPTQWLGVE